MHQLCTLAALLLSTTALAGGADTLGPSAGIVGSVDLNRLTSAGVRLDAPLLASAAFQGRVPGPPPLQVRLGAELWVAPHTAASALNTTSIGTDLSLRHTWPRGLLVEGSAGLVSTRTRDVIKREPTWTTAPTLRLGVGTDLWMSRHRPITAVLRPQVTLLPDTPLWTASVVLQRRLDIAPGR